MVKLLIAFAVFAAVVVFVLMKSGPVELGGEHAAQEAMSKPAEHAAPAKPAEAPK